MHNQRKMTSSLFDDYRKFQKDSRSYAANWFSKHNAPTEKNGYILNSKRTWMQYNIIEESVAEYIQKQSDIKKGKEPYPIHLWIHHGLSSQAACFNFFGPMLVRNDYQPLVHALSEFELVADSCGEFEYTSRDVLNENQGQPTSIDFVIQDGKVRERKFFFEFKLSEAKFGGCSVFAQGGCTGAKPNDPINECYLSAKKGRNYWQLLAIKGFTETEVFKTSPLCPMANYYQFFREILFATEHPQGVFVLIYDDRNPIFNPSYPNNLWKFLMQFVPDNIKSKCTAQSIQTVLNDIPEDSEHDGWSKLFKDKYGID